MIEPETTQERLEECLRYAVANHCEAGFAPFGMDLGGGRYPEPLRGS